MDYEENQAVHLKKAIKLPVYFPYLIRTNTIFSIRSNSLKQLLLTQIKQWSQKEL